MTKQQIISYLKNNDLDIQSAKASLAAIDLAFSNYVESHKLHKVKYKLAFTYISFYKPAVFYQSKKAINKIAEKIYFDYLKNFKSLDKKIEEHHKLTRQLDELWERHKISRYSNKEKKLKELISFFRNFTKISARWWYYGVIGEEKGAIINTKIIPLFQKRHNWSKDRTTNIVLTVAHPREAAVFNMERKNFLKICLYVLNNIKLKKFLINKEFSKILFDKKLKNLINQYIKNYFWFKTDFYRAQKITPQLLLKNISQEIINKNKKEILKELKEINNKFMQIYKEKDKLLRTIKFSSLDKRDLYFAERIIYWIDKRKEGMMKLFYYWFQFIEEVADFLNISYSNLSFYTVSEIENLLNKNKMVSQKIITKRKKGVIMLHETNKPTVLLYGLIVQQIQKYAYKQKDKQNMIKGMAASQGKNNVIQGIIRIVLNPQKDKFKKGEILVTSMTRVEFVPLMRQAKAIITDEGGIACHAAIVSRELGIPAIIGTKIATKILKDGDLVEIDVNNGVIKIL